MKTVLVEFERKTTGQSSCKLTAARKREKEGFTSYSTVLELGKLSSAGHRQPHGGLQRERERVQGIRESEARLQRRKGKARLPSQPRLCRWRHGRGCSRRASSPSIPPRGDHPSPGLSKVLSKPPFLWGIDF